jgi:hypothetical protein
MNAIEKDFRSEMDQLETEELDSKLPKILAGKMERFNRWKDFELTHDRMNYYKGSDEYVWNYKSYTFSYLYDFWLINVDGK